MTAEVMRTLKTLLLLFMLPVNYSTRGVKKYQYTVYFVMPYKSKETRNSKWFALFPRIYIFCAPLSLQVLSTSVRTAMLHSEGK